MKKYAVFAFHAYHPGGGWEDFIVAKESLVEARKAADYATSDEHRKVHGWAYDNSQVVDLEALREVAR